MIFHAKMPLNFWAEAVNTAVYLHNRSPTSSLTDGTPYKHWFGQKLNASNLNIFGSICFVHTPHNLRQKLDPKSRKAIIVLARSRFIYYLLAHSFIVTLIKIVKKATKALRRREYKVYDLESKNFVRSRNVLFPENKFHSFEIFDKETVLEQDDVKGRFDEDGQFTVIPAEPTVNLVTTIYLLSFVETPRKFIIAMINLRGVSTKLNKYIVFTMQTYKKLSYNQS